MSFCQSSVSFFSSYFGIKFPNQYFNIVGRTFFIYLFELLMKGFLFYLFLFFRNSVYLLKLKFRNFVVILKIYILSQSALKSNTFLFMAPSTTNATPSHLFPSSVPLQNSACCFYLLDCRLCPSLATLFLVLLSQACVGRVAQSVQRLPTGWTVRGSNPGRGESFRTCPDRP